MASKAANTAEVAETREEAAEAPLLDSVAAAIKRMLARGKERGYVTYDELNAALPPDQVSSEQIEDTMTMLSELGVNVIENEESEEPAAPEAEEGDGEVRGNLDDDDIGRTDDPVRMYLREMGSVELLSREGEIAIAKRIEAGREMMIGGICENPMTIRAIVAWRDALNEGKMLLRDIIDLDATYGSGVFEPVPAEMVVGRSGRRQSRGRGRRRRGEERQRREAEQNADAPTAKMSRGTRRDRERARRRGGRRRGELDLARRDGSAAEAERAGDFRRYRRNLQKAAPASGPADQRPAKGRAVAARNRAALREAQGGDHRQRQTRAPQQHCASSTSSTSFTKSTAGWSPMKAGCCGWRRVPGSGARISCSSISETSSPAIGSSVSKPCPAAAGRG